MTKNTYRVTLLTSQAYCNAMNGSNSPEGVDRFYYEATSAAEAVGMAILEHPDRQIWNDTSVVLTAKGKEEKDMLIETTINELENYTNKQLRELASAIAAERKSRENEKLKEIVEKTCANLKELDATIQETVEVVVVDYDGEAIPGSLDLLELCDVLRGYLP